MISVSDSSGGTDLPAAVREIFSQTGPLSASKDFEYRPQQEEMAGAVAESFVNERPLIVEAGTGVGKSLSYLVPAAKFALESGRKGIISTHTINLQEQLVRKDIPLVRNILGEELPAVLLKGRRNYLCPPRLRKAWELSRDLFTSTESEELDRIRRWAESTKDGTRSGLPFMPSAKVWLQVCSEPHLCTQKNCGSSGECFYQEARKAAADAKLVVVNHTLFFSLLDPDGMLREDGESMPGFIFPNDFAVLDEAHTIEAIAAKQLGLQVSQQGLRFELQRLYNPNTKKGVLKPYRKVAPMNAVEDSLSAVEQFFAELGDAANFNQRASEFRVRRPELVENQLARPLLNLADELAELAEDTESENSKNELMDAARKMREVQADVGAFLDQRDEKSVYWIERSGPDRDQYSCHGALVDVASRLKPLFFEGDKPLVLTSATLGVGDPNLGYFRKRVGGEAAKALCIGSPFDYKRQMKVRVYRSMPERSSPKYHEMMAKCIMDSITMSDGRTLVLFTSYQLMRVMADRCTPYFKKMGWRFLMQGQGMSPNHLTNEFRNDVSSVLFGTESFWAGVDVPGEALSNVIISQLPFAVPSNPLTASRLEAIEEAGGNPFMEFSVPDAIMKFRQGVGRLIRTKKDVGLVTILDSRILTKRYGKAFFSALPDSVVDVV